MIMIMEKYFDLKRITVKRAIQQVLTVGINYIFLLSILIAKKNKKNL